jgi:hypothetical protein
MKIARRDGFARRGNVGGWALMRCCKNEVKEHRDCVFVRKMEVEVDRREKERGTATVIIMGWMESASATF